MLDYNCRVVSVNISFVEEFDFDIKRYVGLILKIVPQNHLIYLDKINFVDKFPNYDSFDQNCLAYYYFERKSGTIDVNITNIIKEKIPAYYFEYYEEIASLSLSEIIGHEIGHHVARFWKHGIKNREKYAKRYGEACYWNYFASRKWMILLSYFLGGINILDYTKEQRQDFKDSRKRLATSFKEEIRRDNGNIKFP